MPRHWVLWDGSCGVCSASAKWIRKKDTQREFNICQIQSCPSPPMTPELMELGKREMIVIKEDGSFVSGSTAIFFVLGRVGYRWLEICFSIPPLSWAARLGYWIVARNRGLISQVFFRTAACGMENRFPEV